MVLRDVWTRLFYGMSERRFAFSGQSLTECSTAFPIAIVLFAKMMLNDKNN